MKTILSFFLLFALASCATQYATSSATHQGDSKENAVVFENVTNGLVGVQLEYEWIADNFPDYEVQHQSIDDKDGRVFDLISIVNSKGQKKLIYFDVTEWYGRLK